MEQPPSTDDEPDDAPASASRRARRIGGGPRPAPRAEPRPASTAVREDAPEPDTEVVGSDAQAEPEPKKSRAGRNLPAAIAVGLGLGAVIVASLFVYRPTFAYIVGAAAVYGCWELGHALKPATIRIALTPLLVGTVAMLVAAWLRGPNGLVVAALVTVLGIVAWRLGDGARGYTRDMAASALVLLYVPTLAGFAILLVHPDDGAARVMTFLACVVCSDTGGYATGVLFGKHPLAPIVSKGKTWEGSVGSAIFCSAAGVLLMTFTFHQEWWKGLIFGVAIMITATVGDLGASMIKRDVGIKDYGTLLPGHGGVMDRLDSLLPCAAVAYLLLSLLAPV